MKHRAEGNRPPLVFLLETAVRRIEDQPELYGGGRLLPVDRYGNIS
jgi:hypothetical protein